MLLECKILNHFQYLSPTSPVSLSRLLPVSSSSPTSWRSQPGPIPQLSPPFLPPPPIPPSSHEFIMWSKIEQWLFVPVPACHWLRMNNSALMVEVRIREGKKKIILELHHSGYFRNGELSASFLQRTPFLPSCSLSFLPPVHSLPHKKRRDSSLSCLSFKRTENGAQ